MITAVDANVLLDVFADDPTFRGRSQAALRRCLAEGPLIAGDVVRAEVSAAFAGASAAANALRSIPVGYVAIGASAASRAGLAWRAYRAPGGPRERVAADFLVGAHAQEHAERLLTRDRGFHRAAFPGLVIVDPSTAGEG